MTEHRITKARVATDDVLDDFLNCYGLELEGGQDERATALACYYLWTPQDWESRTRRTCKSTESQRSIVAGLKKQLAYEKAHVAEIETKLRMINHFGRYVE